MAGYNNIAGDGMNFNTQSIPPIQYPYNNTNNNFSYDMNYMRGQQNRQFLKCRPVSSREEAIAFQIDLDGSLWVFTNVGNGKIYTKQINNDGTATFNTYTLTKNENPFNIGDYVTKDEFNKVVQSIMAAIAPTSNNVDAAPAPVNNNQNVSNAPMSF